MQIVHIRFKLFIGEFSIEYVCCLFWSMYSLKLGMMKCINTVRKSDSSYRNSFHNVCNMENMFQGANHLLWITLNWLELSLRERITHRPQMIISFSFLHATHDFDSQRFSDQNNWGWLIWDLFSPHRTWFTTLL